MQYDEWEVPSAVLRGTEAAFRAGQHEVFVLWTASLQNLRGTCRIRRLIVPQQEPGTGPFGGVYVRVEGAELVRIALDNFQRSERSVVQLHTHPSEDVDMSELDRAWEVTNHDGALSIIVPSYGRGALDGLPGARVYERTGVEWRPWTDQERAARIRQLA
jgi:proteasome lid subunit RPN8/RPN11